MSTFQKAFTLIELLIVNAIIAVLATIAVPEYQNFIGRAQVAEAVVLLRATRAGIEEYILEAGSFPENEKFATMNISRGGSHTKKLNVVIADACSTAGVIQATLKYAGISPKVAGRTFVIERDIEGNWRCARGGEDSLEDKFLPKSCHIAPVPAHDYPICPLFKTGNDMPANGGDNTVVADSSDSGDGDDSGSGGSKSNNGHGNNYDSVDVSNPGKGKGKGYDPSGSHDDEMG